MNTQKVHRENAIYQKFEVLQNNRNKRYRYQEFIVEGVRNINTAIANRWRIRSFLYPGEKELSAWAKALLDTVETNTNYVLAERLMERLSKKQDCSELLAVVQMKEDAQEFDLPECPILALFDRPSNKGNLGTMFRSCDALGVHGLLITGHAVDVYEPDVISASMGSFFRVPFMRLSDNVAIDAYLQKLKIRYPQMQCIGTTAHAQDAIHDLDLTTPLLFLIGNETDGLNQHYIEICDKMATIPMSAHASASSLNVSCAATILFYEAGRQRETGKL